MASISWPGNVPDKPLIDGFSERPGTTTVRTQMDVGPDKLRRRTTAAVSTLTMRMLMTKTEVGNLETFYDGTTAQGSLRFDFVHPRTGSTVEARFVERPRWQIRTDDDYEVQIKLEVLP